MHNSYLTHNYLSDCDADDNVGCEAGLTCGENNCAQFHEIGEGSGFHSSSDCCEGNTHDQLSAIEIELFGQAINMLAVVVVTAMMGDACMITS